MYIIKHIREQFCAIFREYVQFSTKFHPRLLFQPRCLLEFGQNSTPDSYSTPDCYSDAKSRNKICLCGERGIQMVVTAVCLHSWGHGLGVLLSRELDYFNFQIFLLKLSLLMHPQTLILEFFDASTYSKTRVGVCIYWL